MATRLNDRFILERNEPATVLNRFGSPASRAGFRRLRALRTANDDVRTELVGDQPPGTLEQRSLVVERQGLIDAAFGRTIE